MLLMCNGRVSTVGHVSSYLLNFWSVENYGCDALEHRGFDQSDASRLVEASLA